MGSLRAGFDVVSTHVILILLPTVLDILLWLGPRLSVGGLTSPALPPALKVFPGLKQLAEFQAGTQETIEHFNLLSLLSRLEVFPIGVSSLLVQKLSVETPFGTQRVVEISSGSAMGLMLLLIVLGWMIGGLYFRWVSGIVLGEEQSETEVSFGQAIFQTLILSAIWMIGFIVVVVPIMLFLLVLLLYNPLLASALFFAVLVLSFWLIVPLFFTPHGIFMRRQNAFYSIFTSLRMARFTFPTSGLFVVCVLILSTGLDVLWNVPPDNSWMKLVGIGGHAFITTALLAASFVYYRDMNVWLQTVFERLQQKQGLPTQQV